MYLETSKQNGRLMYLHRIKHIGPSFELSAGAEAYWLGLESSTHALADAVASLGIAKFELVVAPPSSSAHLYAPYRAALKRRLEYFEDVSGDLGRAPEAGRSARLESVNEVIDSWVFDPPEVRPATDPVNVLFIDDVYAGGKTAAAAHHHLAQWLGGRRIALTIACPLKAVASQADRVDEMALAGPSEE